jgi:hypothetical protein
VGSAPRGSPEGPRAVPSPAEEDAKILEHDGAVGYRMAAGARRAQTSRTPNAVPSPTSQAITASPPRASGSRRAKKTHAWRQTTPKGCVAPRVGPPKPAPRDGQ